MWQENGASEGLDFAELFTQYKRDVHPGAQVRVWVRVCLCITASVCLK